MSRFQGNLHINGTLSATGFTPPSNSIGNDALKSGDPIDALKLQHGKHFTYSQESATPAADGAHVMQVAAAAGELLTFKAGAVVPAVGDATVTVDLLKNGVSVLMAPITLDSNQAARELVAANFNAAAYAVGSIFEIQITGAAGTGTLPAGVFAHLVTKENPQ